MRLTSLDPLKARSVRERYGVALSLAVLATVLYVSLGRQMHSTPYLFFLAAVMVSAYLGGTGPGLLNVLVSIPVSVYFYIPPLHHYLIDDISNLLFLLFFVAIAVAVSWLSGLRQDREREVAAAHRQTRNIIDSISDAFVVTDLDLRYVYINRAAEVLFDRPRGELLGKRVTDVFSVDDDVQNALREALGERKTVHLQHHSQRRNGWYDIHVYPSETGLSILYRDATDQKRTEERSAFLAKASGILAGSLDEDTTMSAIASLAVPEIADWCAVHLVEGNTVRQIAVAHVNPEKVRIAAELQQRYPYDPEAPTGVPNALRTLAPELTPIIDEQLIVDAVPDEALRDIIRSLGLRSSMVVPMVARGRGVGAITFVSAESDRHYGAADVQLAEDLASRAALAVDNARLYREATQIGAERSAILSQMLEGVVVVNAAGVTTYVNQAAGRLGVQAPDQDITTLLGEPYDPEEMPLRKVLRDHEPVLNAVWRSRMATGEERIIQGSASLITDSDGISRGAVATFRDITAQHMLDRQKDAFLAAAAHDLKTPLATIKGFAQILQRRLRRSETVDVESTLETLQQIDTAVTRMSRLINEMLDASRTQMDRPLPLNLQPADLVPLIRRVVDEFQQASDGHRIVTQSAPAELVTVCDGERIERVLGNLVSNAVKYSPEGSQIDVTLAQEAGTLEQQVLIQVQDRGVGIPAEDLPHVFERFYRSRNVEGLAPGTGIGLSGVKQIVEQHGGSIEITSTEHQGTTVAIRLPIRTEAEIHVARESIHG